MTKFYVDEDGNYIGGFDGAEPPEGSVEVPIAPDNARQKYLSGAWQDIEYTWDDVKNIRREMFRRESDTKDRLARYLRQDAKNGRSPQETSTKYQEMLTYFEDIEDCDETNHSTPQEALDALTALTEPTE